MAAGGLARDGLVLGRDGGELGLLAQALGLGRFLALALGGLLGALAIGFGQAPPIGVPVAAASASTMPWVSNR